MISLGERLKVYLSGVSEAVREQPLTFLSIWVAVVFFMFVFRAVVFGLEYYIYIADHVGWENAFVRSSRISNEPYNPIFLWTFESRFAPENKEVYQTILELRKSFDGGPIFSYWLRMLIFTSPLVAAFITARAYHNDVELLPAKYWPSVVALLLLIACLFSMVVFRLNCTDSA